MWNLQIWKIFENFFKIFNEVRNTPSSAKFEIAPQDMREVTEQRRHDSVYRWSGGWRDGQGETNIPLSTLFNKGYNKNLTIDMLCSMSQIA